MHKRCLEKVGGKVLYRGWDLSTTEAKKMFVINILTFLFYLSLTAWIFSGQSHSFIVGLMYRLTGNVDIFLIMEMFSAACMYLYFLFFLMPGFFLRGPFFMDFFRQALIMEKGIALHAYNPLSKMYWFYSYENIVVFYLRRKGLQRILFGNVKDEFLIYVEVENGMVSGVDSITSRNFYDYNILSDLLKKRVRKIYNAYEFEELLEEYRRERQVRYVKMKKMKGERLGLGEIIKECPDS